MRRFLAGAPPMFAVLCLWLGTLLMR
eukprot:SAG11_NODE_6768_length_1251_cov_13.323785_1_plen_25_part_10